MTVTDIRISKIFITENDHQLNKIISFLHDDEKVAGVTVYRAIEGYGDSGDLHQSSLVDFNFDSPLVIEFYDKPEKILQVIEDVKKKFEIKKVISWLAEQY